MKFVKRQFAKIIARFWRHKPINELDLILMGNEHNWLDDLARVTVENTREEQLSELIAKRDRLRKAKKRFSHIQADIEKIRTQQLRGA